MSDVGPSSSFLDPGVSLPAFLGEDPPQLASGAVEESEPRSSTGAPRVAVVPVGYEGTVSYGGGTARGPGAILEASTHLELWDEELRTESWRVGIETRDGVFGDEPPEAFLPRVEAACREAIDAGRVPVMLGGEHSITAPAIRACRREHPDLSVLQIDAHTDLRDTFEGTPGSHACVMRRVAELGVDIVQVGIRSVSPEEVPILEAGRVPDGGRIVTHFAHDGLDAPRIDRAIDALGDRVYVTFDLDALDPAILPATGTPEPGGLDWYGALAILREVFRRREVVGLDVVELAPIDGHHASDFLAAKLTYRMIGYLARSRGWIG